MTKEHDPLAEGRKAQAAAVAAQEEMDKIPPTPSQAEVNAAKLGVDVADLPTDDDEDGVSKSETKAAESKKPAGTYQNRSAKSE